jgi:hypothetical protein
MSAAVAKLPLERRGRTAADLYGMVFPPIKWVVEDYIAEGLTVLAGKPKLGKSWLLMAVAIAVAGGGYVLGDRKCAQGAVLYAALEDTERRLRSRLEKLCGGFKPAAWPLGLTFWSYGEMERLSTGGLDQVRAWIREHPDARLVIIDTLAKVRSGPQGKETAYDADYREVGSLKALADDTGVAIVVVTHTRKMGADDPFDTVSGTLGITGAADATMILTRDDQGVTLHATGRDVAEIETALEWDKEACRWRVLGDAQEVRRSDERTKILEALEGETEPVGPREIADATGHPYTAVRALLVAMSKSDEVRKVGRGKYLHPGTPFTTLTGSQPEGKAP